MSTDPLQKKFPAWSTYNYVMGNPIIFTDPTGKSPNPPDWYENDRGEIQYWPDVTKDEFTETRSTFTDGKFTDTYDLDWKKINYVPNQQEALLPEMSQDMNAAVTILQGMVQVAAESSPTDFKYIEGPGIPKNSHVAPLNQISKTAGNFGTFYTIADKGVVTTNALIDGKYETAAKEATLLTAYSMAAYMMMAPTGVTQIIGGVMFLAIGIYDMFD